MQFALQYGVNAFQGYQRLNMIFYVIWKLICHFLLAINSNLDFISHRFQDMASFPLKNAHFSYPFHSTPNYSSKILYAKSLDKKLITNVKSFPL